MKNFKGYQKVFLADIVSILSIVFGSLLIIAGFFGTGFFSLGFIVTKNIIAIPLVFISIVMLWIGFTLLDYGGVEF